MDLMRQLLPLANDVGLFAEMMAPDGAGSAGRDIRPQFLGNLPPGLSHLSMINAAAAIDDAGAGTGAAGSAVG